MAHVIPKQLSELTQQDFQRYEKIRKQGAWNMYAPQAQQSSGLDDATYIGVLTHYTQLMELYPEVRLAKVIE